MVTTTWAGLGALLDEWLPGAERGPNTRDNHEGLIERFIRPALGALPLSRVTPQRIERFCSELWRCRARCDGRPFVVVAPADLAGVAVQTSSTANRSRLSSSASHLASASVDIAKWATVPAAASVKRSSAVELMFSSRSQALW